MRESSVDYARHVAPLQRKLDAALASSRRTRRAAAGIAIILDEGERVAFDHVKEMLASSATLGFPEGQATTYLLTNASDVGWALIVSPVDNFDPKKPATQQQHKLLQCMSGTFTGSQLNWALIDKATFPIIMDWDKLDYLLLRPQAFRMYRGHRNLIHIFAPDASVKKHVQGKLLRWAIKLMNFRYIIQPVPGSDNVGADRISRWAGNHVPTARPTGLKAFRRRRSSSTQYSPYSTLRPLDDEAFIWLHKHNWPTSNLSLRILLMLPATAKFFSS
ncbi:unnamed protein product [Phytophthora fragariaefolia]|uniref:Unnamed protein product n=1 Tax=Phytophthora fragariaefolia TaxID=1490495 RepID=A0A9W6XSN8_9STRA|nr:unnamed protein product [Phytophthora fragariaefolia]